MISRDDPMYEYLENVRKEATVDGYNEGIHDMARLLSKMITIDSIRIQKLIDEVASKLEK